MLNMGMVGCGQIAQAHAAAFRFGPVRRVYAATRRVFGYDVEDTAALTSVAAHRLVEPAYRSAHAGEPVALAQLPGAMTDLVEEAPPVPGRVN